VMFGDGAAVDLSESDEVSAICVALHVRCVM
jgi:hypothetical protein